MLGEEVGALGGAPCDGAEDAAVLLQRHLEVTVLQHARTVDDLHAPRGEHGTRVPGAERRERGDAGGHAAGDAAKSEVGIDAQSRHQVLRPENLVRDGVDRQPQFLDPIRLERETRRLFVSAEADEQVRTALERAEHVELGDAAARAVRDAVLDRQHDRRPVERIHELAGHDADDAAMPSLAGDDEHRSRADIRIGLDDLPRRREDLRLFLLAPQVLPIELHRETPRLVGHRLVGREQQPRGDVGRAHAPRRVDARRQQKRDVVAVDRLAGQPRDVEQRAQSDLVRAARQHVEPDLRDDPVLTHEGDDIGQRTDGGDLDEAREPALALGGAAERLHQLQGDADAREVLVRIAAVVAFGIDDGERGRQLRVGLVMIGDDQIDAQLARAARRLGAADAAVDRDDQRHPVGVQPFDCRRLQSVAVLQPLRDEMHHIGAK